MSNSSMVYPWRWLTSGMVRRVHQAIRQLERLENEQRDLLGSEEIGHLRRAREHARDRVRAGDQEALEGALEELSAAAAKWLRPYRYAGIRENVKEFLVAIVTIIGFTTFFLQLTKIPTGSMQPSLYGITYENLANGLSADGPNHIPSVLRYWLFGTSLKKISAPFDGYVLKIDPVQSILPFLKRQQILFGDPLNAEKRVWLTLWSPPDDRWPQAAEISGKRLYRAGESIVYLKSFTGDHLLVDRFTYNFRHPSRGEVIVFKTKGIQQLPQDVLYIKRLVGLPKEALRIGDDQHLVIDGRRLTASDKHFEKVYTITNPGESHYSGHLNEYVGRNKFDLSYSVAPLFPDESTTYAIPPHSYFAMGDNTFNSADSRTWGTVPEENIIGKCWFVYWPFTKRFGWGTW